MNRRLQRLRKYGIYPILQFKAVQESILSLLDEMEHRIKTVREDVEKLRKQECLDLGKYGTLYMEEHINDSSATLVIYVCISGDCEVDQSTPYTLKIKLPKIE